MSCRPSHICVCAVSAPLRRVNKYTHTLCTLEETRAAIFPRGSKFWEILGIALFSWDLHASPQKAYFRPSESSPSSVGPPAQNAPDWGDAAKGGRTVGGDGGRRQL
jgi:hypothetical protein